MKQFSKQNFNRQDDIQIQVPTARIGIKIDLDAVALENVLVRARLVSPEFGTRTIIERTGLKTLFEIAAQGEGFYRTENIMPADILRVQGCIDITNGGALNLNNQRYITFDLYTANGETITSVDVYSMQHPKLTDTYLHYNQVTVNQSLQSIQLDRASAVVLPIENVEEVQLHYAGTSVPHTNQELRFIADMSNDLVSVSKLDTGAVSAGFGYEGLVILPVRDPLSMMEASRLQIERTANAPAQFNILLIEEKSL